MEKPRVLFTTSTLPREAGDPQPRFVLDLARAAKPWIDPQLLAPSFPGPCADQSELMGVPRTLFRYAPAALETLAYRGGIPSELRNNPLKWCLVPGYLGGLYRKTRQLVRQGGVDAVVANWLIPQGVVQSYIGEVPYFPYLLGADTYTLNNPVIRRFKERALRRAAHTFVVSRAMLARVRELFPWLEASRCTVLPTGVDTERFSPRSPSPARFDGLERPILLFVGRLDYKKGVETLIRAFHSVCGSGRRGVGTLVVVGSGGLEERLRMISGQGAGRDRVVFMPAVNHEHLPGIMASADVFCCPSIRTRTGDQEGRPTVLAEAGASGLPLMGSRIAGVDEFIEEGRNGWLVTPGDVEAWAVAIAGILAQRDRWSEFGENAMRRAEIDDWRHVGATLSSVLSGVLEKTSRRPL